MQEILKIVFMGIITAFLVVLLKSIKPEFVIPILIIASCSILISVITEVSQVLTAITDILSLTDIDHEFCKIIIKICGMCFVCNFASSLCRDCGCNVVAENIETAGKISITAFVLPLAISLLELISEILKSNVFNGV